MQYLINFGMITKKKKKKKKKNDSKNDSKNDGKSDTKMIRKTCAFFQSHKNNLLFSHQTILVISVRNKACIFF